MKKVKILSVFTSLTMMCAVLPVTVSAAEQTRYTRVMEYLDRGLMAIPKPYWEDGDTGMFLSWRLLGTEDLAATTFDIYKDGIIIEENYNGNSYTDTSNTDGADTDAVYYVVVHGEEITDADVPANTVIVNGIKKTLTLTDGYETVSTGNSNCYGYFDIPIDIPADVSDETVGDYTYSANDCSVGDVDGDGQYEIIVKWYPSVALDSATSGYTGKTLFACYELDGTMLWEDTIDLGYNIRSGSHYTQFIVYDLDADGYSEIVMKTAPGSTDAKGNYVSEAGNTDEIINTDNTADYRNSSGRILEGPEYLTVFSGATGEALQTIDYTPVYGDVSADLWGDTYGNRADRYLAAVGYFGNADASGNLLPSVVMCRGYYSAGYAVAYDWDGENLTQRWYHKGEEGGTTIYGQGNHNLAVTDADNDGYDEIVYGSAVIDNDGSLLSTTGQGHGDALHVNDFNNDGAVEVFQVHESGVGTYGGDFWIPATGSHIFGMYSEGDVAKGAMANIDDAYASENSGALAMAFTTSHDNAYTSDGTELNARPNASSRYLVNSFVYWDGELDRELLDDNIMASYDAENGYTTRFYFGSNGYMPLSTNNSTKYNMSLTADILGDWREEIISPCAATGTTTLRVYISTLETDYKLTTLMHDSQYRSGVAAENVGYNVPPHTSYYIGSAALASEEDANYLAPAYAYTKLVTANEAKIDMDEYHFDFGGGDVQDGGYTQVTATTAYSKTSGYGFSDVTDGMQYNMGRAPGSDIPDGYTNLYSDQVEGNKTDSEFKADIANGTYKVTIHYGSWSTNFGTNYTIEGVNSGNLYSTSAAQYVTTVTVTDGQLNLTISKGAQSYGGYIAGMDIVPVVMAKKIVADDIDTAQKNEDAIGYYVEDMQIADTAVTYNWVITMTDNLRFVRETSLPTMSGAGSVSFGMVVYGVLENGDTQYTTSDISQVTVE